MALKRRLNNEIREGKTRQRSLAKKKYNEKRKKVTLTRKKVLPTGKGRAEECKGLDSFTKGEGKRKKKKKNASTAREERRS